MLATTLDTEQATELTPLFGQLFAVKDLRAMYVERQNSLKQQAECADHAARHLDRTIATMASYLEIEVDPTWQANLGIMDLVTPPPTVEPERPLRRVAYKPPPQTALPLDVLTLVARKDAHLATLIAAEGSRGGDGDHESVVTFT